MVKLSWHHCFCLFSHHASSDIDPKARAAEGSAPVTPPAAGSTSPKSSKDTRANGDTSKAADTAGCDNVSAKEGPIAGDTTHHETPCDSVVANPEEAAATATTSADNTAAAAGDVNGGGAVGNGAAGGGNGSSRGLKRSPTQKSIDALTSVDGGSQCHLYLGDVPGLPRHHTSRKGLDNKVQLSTYADCVGDNLADLTTFVDEHLKGEAGWERRGWWVG